MTKATALLIASTMLVGLPVRTGANKNTTPKTPSSAPAAARVVALGATDAMKFEPATIQAKPGERLRVVLKPTATMPKIAMAHNFVILKPGSDIAAFANASAMARPDFLAPTLKHQVLVASTLAGNGETVSVEFAAPTKPGQYTFICTFPGHFAAGMKGTLVVK